MEEKVYYPQNKITLEYLTVKADSAQEACEKVNWMMEDCHVKLFGVYLDNKFVRESNLNNEVRKEILGGDKIGSLSPAGKE